MSSSNDPTAAPVLGDVAGLVPALPPVPAVEEVSVALAAAPPPAIAAGQEIQGISQQKLLEPIQREAPKLGRKNGVSNLTAAQKLEILHELVSQSLEIDPTHQKLSARILLPLLEMI